MRFRPMQESISQVFKIIIGIIGFCVLISLFHVVNTQKIYRRQSLESLDGHFSICLDVINDEVNKMEEHSRKYSSIVAEADGDLGKMTTILAEASAEGEKYEAYYVKESPYVYSKDGIFYNERYYHSLLSFPVNRYDDNYMCARSSEVDCFERNDALVSITKIVGENGEKSYFVLYKDTSNLLNKKSFDYINNIGTTVVIDVTGTIMNISKASDELAVGDDVFDYLSDLSDTYPFSLSKITDVKYRLSSSSEDSFTVNSKDGHEIYVSYRKIEGVRGIYLCEIYNESVFEEMISAGVIGAAITCIMLIAILFVAMTIMFGRMRNGRIELEKLAYSDAVTEGYNYNYFKTRAMNLLMENPEIHFIMCRFDIMNFRYINEAYGHKKADAVLKACYDKFKETFSSKEVCVRVNSDQFVAIIINDLEMNHRFQKYNRLVEEVARTEGVRFSIRFKTGFYQIRKEDREIDLMIDRANVARKSVEVNKKISEAVYSEEIILNMRKVDAIESQMDSALTKDEFKIYLQPKWDIINDCIMGAEALVRWVKKDGTIVSPGDFIPVFESNGFIEKLDFHMLERICARLYEIEKNPQLKPYPISVNQSRILINNPDYIKNVEKVLSRYDIDRKNIQLEITETVFFDEKEKMIEVVNRLKEFGLTLDMDDFGSGYSSLNILKDIAFDVLKIDKEFFSESTASETSIVILQKIIEMAELLHLEVICEGVETKEQVELLKSVGCKAVQGYYYGKPMPIDEFVEKYCRV